METLQTPWPVLLHYEHECRKSAFRRVREEGLTLANALRQAMADPELKEVHFTSPIALSHMTSRATKRPAEAASSSSSGPPPKKARTNAKAQKNKSKGKGKGNQVGSTADGRQICFNYNSPRGCSDPKCSRIHCCRNKGCGGLHPAFECPKARPSS